MVDHEVEGQLLQLRRQRLQVAGLDPELHVPAALGETRRQGPQILEAHATRRHRLAVLPQQIDPHAAEAGLGQLVEPPVAHLGLQQRHTAQAIAMALQRIECHLVVAARRQRMHDHALGNAERVPQRQQALDRRLARRRELSLAHRWKAIEGTVDVHVAVHAAFRQGDFLAH